ncbi:MAG: M23 family metallopeptidase, partial [Candidatus Aminicenantes bacterium]
MKTKEKSKGKNYSVIIVSGATSTNKEFVISSKLIRNSIIALSILLLIFGFIIYDYLRISFDEMEMERLRGDNIQKEQVIDELSKHIRDIEVKLKQMAIYKERISVAMGLTSPDALKEVGIGGGEGSITNAKVPGGVKVPDSELVNKSKETPQASQDILKKANEIHKEAKKIQERLKFVESVMEQQKVRLASTPSIWPTKGYLTSSLGWRTHPLTGKRDFHNGQDIATQYGNKVIATADGVILVAEHWD